jgi:tryptophan synthase alpha subunit
MDIKEEIKKCNYNKNLSIIIYTILGYPDRFASIEALKILKDNDITVFETALPLCQGYSPSLSESIISAHQIACINEISHEDVFEIYSKFRPNLFIIHEGTEYSSVEELLKKMKNRVDAILFPWNEKEIEKNVRICNYSGIKVVQEISPMMNRKEIKKIINYIDGLVYLTAANKTGGKLYKKDKISSTIEIIKSIRTDIPVCCGFGLKNIEDVKEIGSIKGCDGVIIGTAILDILKKGLKTFEQYVNAIMDAAKGLKG